jgi:FkbM family methyltransferase
MNNKIYNLFLALTRINLKSLYHILVRSNESLPVIDTCDNKYGYFTGIKNDYIFNCIKNNEINEKHFEDLVKLVVKPNNNCIDLGANIGSHTTILSKLVSDGEVFSFEPQSLTFSLLQNNILLNSCKNVTAFKFAISNSDLEVLSMDPFSYSGETINNSSLRVNTSKNHTGDMTIAKKLDDFIFPQINFIKIDIQGSETNALKGAEKLLLRDRPMLFIEIEEQHLLAFGSSSKDLIELILSYDYVLFRIKTNYPCDHICVAKNKVKEFEQNTLNKFNYNTEKIEGTKVSLTFESKNDQNYKKIEIIN